MQGKLHMGIVALTHPYMQFFVASLTAGIKQPNPALGGIVFRCT